MLVEQPLNRFQYQTSIMQQNVPLKRHFEDETSILKEKNKRLKLDEKVGCRDEEIFSGSYLVHKYQDDVHFRY